jgi:predicted dehydrogenase
MSKLTRRDFAKAVAATSITTALSGSRVLGANDRIHLGFIGLGNRGDDLLNGFLVHKDAEVVAIYDIYQPYLDFASKKIGNNPKQFKSYQELLDMRDVDAVVICMPDH